MKNCFLDQQRLMQRAIDLQSICRWHFVLYFNKFLLIQRAVDLQNVDVWNIDLRPVDLQICTHEKYTYIKYFITHFGGGVEEARLSGKPGVSHILPPVSGIPEGSFQFQYNTCSCPLAYLSAAATPLPHCKQLSIHAFPKKILPRRTSSVRNWKWILNYVATRTVYRARTFKRLWSPGIDSKE